MRRIPMEAPVLNSMPSGSPQANKPSHKAS